MSDERRTQDAKEPRLGRVNGARIVIQQRRQPAFSFLDGPILAAGVIFHLVALYLAYAEIAAFGMGIIEARDRRARPHGKAFGELDADLPLRVQQLEQGRLLAVLGLGGITRRGADAAIF